MLSFRFILKLLPWLLLLVVAVTLYLSNYSFFGKNDGDGQDVIESTTILKEIENLGKLELVKYNFNEVFEYRKLSTGKTVGSSIFKTYDYVPDISVLLIASGEAVGCLDLTKIKISDISNRADTLVLSIPPPELCYHKLDLDKTRIYSTNNESWWSKIFSDQKEQSEVLQMAYRQAEVKLQEAAVASGIFRSTNENAKTLLIPLLHNLTGKEIIIETSIPDQSLFPSL